MVTSNLPAMTSREVRRVLVRAGWTRVRRQKGSHIILSRADGSGRVIVPDHPGDLPPGTLRGILAQAGLTPERFNELRLGRD